MLFVAAGVLIVLSFLQLAKLSVGGEGLMDVEDSVFAGKLVAAVLTVLLTGGCIQTCSCVCWDDS